MATFAARNSRPLNNITKANLAALGANFIFAANYSIVKLITPAIIKPFGLNLARVLVSITMFWSFYLFKPSNPGIKRKHIGLFIICGATGIAINQMLFIKGLSLTTSIHASLLSLGTPVFIIIIAAWLLKEPLTVNKIVGLILGIGGAALLVASKDATGNGSDMLLGDMLVLGNAICYSLYLVLVRPLMQEYSPLHVLRWVFTIGTIVILPFGWNQFNEVNWMAMNVYHWLALAFVTFGATFLAYLWNVYSLQHISPSTTGTYIYTQPVFAAIIAIIFLGENITTIKVASALLIFAGVFVVNIRTKLTGTRAQEESGSVS